MDGCIVLLDCWMIVGEIWESCLEEICNLLVVKKYGDDVMVLMYNYDCFFYIDLIYEIECYFLMWVILENYDVIKVLMEMYKNFYGEIWKGFVEILEMCEECLLLDKWIFLINGVLIMGCNGIFCIGFGLGVEV